MAKTINTPTGWGNKLNSIMEQRYELSGKERDKLLKMFQQDKETRYNNSIPSKLPQDKIEKLKGKKKLILEDLKKNYVKIEENVGIYWYGWKKVHIELPAVWNFKWFKFWYFISDFREEGANILVFNDEIKNKLFSSKEIWKLLQAMNCYMAELWVRTDWNMDYENDLRLFRTHSNLYEEKKCKVWDCLKEITWLDWMYTLLPDRVDDWAGASRTVRDCRKDRCWFESRRWGRSPSTQILMKL